MTNLFEGDANIQVSIDELYDGEAFLLTEVNYGIERDQLLISRECAKMLIKELQEMIGDD